jgi:hypothetical protein
MDRARRLHGWGEEGSSWAPSAKQEMQEQERKNQRILQRKKKTYNSFLLFPVVTLFA